MTLKWQAEKAGGTGSFGLGTAMVRYEFRILTREGRLQRVLGCNQTSDFAAICYAKAYISADGGVEVWRGMECIYSECGPQHRQGRRGTPG